MTLADAVIGLKAYKEVEKRTNQLWQDVNIAVILPRMDITREKLPGIQVNGVRKTYNHLIAYADGSLNTRMSLSSKAPWTSQSSICSQTWSRS